MKYSRLVFVPAAVVFATTTVPTVAYRWATAGHAATAPADRTDGPPFLAAEVASCDAVGSSVQAFAPTPAEPRSAVAALSD